MQLLNKTVILLLSIFAVCFLIYKATNTSITHDEAITFNRYLSLNPLDIIAYKRSSTNNHILNTLFVKVFNKIFGSSEISIRMPNILSGAVYFLCVFLLIRNLNNCLVLIGFVLMTCNPFLLDFFALARGYGLAMATMLCSIYCYLQYLKSMNTRWFSGSLFFASLTLFSNFALFNYFFALLAFHVIILPLLSDDLRKEYSIKKFFRYNWPIFICLLILTAFLYEPIRRLPSPDRIDFGGTVGFWQDTVMTLIDTSCYTYSPASAYMKLLLEFLIPLILIATLLFWAWGLVKKRKQFFSENLSLIFVNLILLLVVLSTVVQHHLLGTPYLTDRFALFLVPLFMLNVVYLFDAIVRVVRWKLLPIFIVLFPAVFLFSYTLNELNVDYYPMWKYDMNDKLVLKELERQNKKIELRITWLFEPSINFYRNTKGLTWLNEQDRESPKPGADYYYLTEQYLDSVPDCKTKPAIQYENTKTYLVKYR